MEISGVTLQAQSESNPTLNGNLKKSGEGKEEGCVKAQYVWASTSHCTFWLKCREMEISTASLGYTV
jgi:hypothetical protein